MDKLRGLYRLRRTGNKSTDDDDEVTARFDDSESLSSALSSSSCFLLADDDDEKVVERKVRFSKEKPSVCEQVPSYHDDDFSIEELQSSLWYSGTELSQNKRVARHLINCSRPLFQTDVDAMGNAFYAAHSLSRTLDSSETQELLSNSSSSDTKKAAALFAGHGGVENFTRSSTTSGLTRGLEDSLCPDIASGRNAIARESRLIVLELHYGPDDNDMVATEYQDLSRTSLILARIQAMADERDVMIDQALFNNHTAKSLSSHIIPKRTTNVLQAQQQDMDDLLVDNDHIIEV